MPLSAAMSSEVQPVKHRGWMYRNWALKTVREDSDGITRLMASEPGDTGSVIVEVFATETPLRFPLRRLTSDIDKYYEMGAAEWHRQWAIGRSPDFPVYASSFYGELPMQYRTDTAK